jgi:hypothetical protein
LARIPSTKVPALIEPAQFREAIEPIGVTKAKKEQDLPPIVTAKIALPLLEGVPLIVNPRDPFPVAN